jgi:hypothetical protein
LYWIPVVNIFYIITILYKKDLYNLKIIEIYKKPILALISIDLAILTWLTISLFSAFFISPLMGLGCFFTPICYNYLWLFYKYKKANV